jgi:hypothetical protein
MRTSNKWKDFRSLWQVAGRPWIPSSPWRIGWPDLAARPPLYTHVPAGKDAMAHVLFQCSPADTDRNKVIG